MLVVDGTRPLEKQDLSIARVVEEEGRALVLAVNKWDLVENRSKALKDLAEQLETRPGAIGRDRMRDALGQDRRRDRQADAGGVRGT